MSKNVKKYSVSIAIGFVVGFIIAWFIVFPQMARTNGDWTWPALLFPYAVLAMVSDLIDGDELVVILIWIQYPVYAVLVVWADTNNKLDDVVWPALMLHSIIGVGCAMIVSDGV